MTNLSYITPCRYCYWQDKEVLIINTPQDTKQYQRLLGDGSQWGISIMYKFKISGLAAAFYWGGIYRRRLICLILGDNIFYGLDFSKQLEDVVKRTKLGSKATIFGYTVKDPQRYGIEFDDKELHFS